MFSSKIKRKIYLNKIMMAHLISKFKISLFTLFLSKNSIYRKCLLDLKRDGVTILPNYFDLEKTKQISKECYKELNKIPKNIIKENIENYILENQINIEKIKGSIKLKAIQKSNKNIKKLVKNNFLSLFSGFYSYGLSSFKRFLGTIKNGPLLIYHLTHDGSFDHYTVPEGVDGKMIAGEIHVDSPMPGIKGFIALEKINIENGPICYFKKSNSFKHLKEFYLDLFLAESGIEKNNDTSRRINEKLIKYCKDNFSLYEGCVNPGDLILFDTSGVHYASQLTKGQRHVLFKYY